MYKRIYESLCLTLRTVLSLNQERGIHFHSGFELDEETKYSSVFRGVDDSGYDESEDIWDSENIETFGDVSDSAINKSLTNSENRFLLIC